MIVADPDNRPDRDPVLTIQDVSRLLQIPAPTIRSWERRYGIPSAGPPTRRQAGGSDGVAERHLARHSGASQPSVT